MCGHYSHIPCTVKPVGTQTFLGSTFGFGLDSYRFTQVKLTIVSYIEILLKFLFIQDSVLFRVSVKTCTRKLSQFLYFVNDSTFVLKYFILQSVHLLYKYAIRINFCFIRTIRINFSAYE
jgi:hypothetical protein